MVSPATQHQNGPSQDNVEPQWVELLRAQPLVQGLTPDHLALLVGAAEVTSLGAGETFLREDTHEAGLFLLLAGEIAVRKDGRLATLLRAPQVLGVLALIDGQARSATLSAFADSLIVHIPRTTFEHLRQSSTAFLSNLTLSLAADLRRMYANETRQLAHFDDSFEAPNAKLVPGPYVAQDVDMVLLVLQGDPHRLAALMPRGLRPIPGFGDRFLLTFNFFSGVHSESPIARGKTFDYSETCPFLPCLGPHLQPAVFTPELYPDNLLAIALGREAYGFPKRFGRTMEAQQSIDLSVGGHMTLRAKWQSAHAVTSGEWANHLAGLWTGGVELPALLTPVLTRAIDAADHHRFAALRPKVPVFVHKQIVGVGTESERMLDVDSLIEIPFHLTKLGPFQVLDGAAVDFLDPAYFLQGTCLGGVRLSLGFRFGTGKSWIDYKAAAKTSGALGAMLERWRTRP
jgi:CRP-like cAMP-binding protein